MTQRAKRPKKIQLGCHWVEEEGFAVVPIQSSPPDSGTTSDTTFLLKLQEGKTGEGKVGTRTRGDEAR